MDFVANLTFFFIISGKDFKVNYFWVYKFLDIDTTQSMY